MNEMKSRETYYAGAESWARDRQEELRASRRIAWIAASAAAVVAVCEALALLFLMPLKTVVPYTLMVDRQTGFVQELKPIDPAMVSADTALTQSFLVQYVIGREGYDANSVQTDYHKIALWSLGQARADYVATMQPSNPDSPIARLPRSTVVEVRVKSVTSIGTSVSMVRYQTVRHDAGGRDAAPQDWVAVIRYEYTGAPQSLDDRLVNPLGFKVTRYRTSAETLPPPETAPVATATPVAVIAPTVRVVPNTLSGYPRTVVRPVPYR